MVDTITAFEHALWTDVKWIQLNSACSPWHCLWMSFVYQPVITTCFPMKFHFESCMFVFISCTLYGVVSNSGAIRCHGCVSECTNVLSSFPLPSGRLHSQRAVPKASWMSLREFNTLRIWCCEDFSWHARYSNACALSECQPRNGLCQCMRAASAYRAGWAYYLEIIP